MVNRTPAAMLALVLCLLIQLVSASENLSIKEILFNGQEQESHTLLSELTETRYRTEMQDTTCYRQVPYQDQECEMVPEYDTQCETIPGYNDCSTEYDRQCRNVTGHRTECEGGPPKRQCRNVRRTRQECRMDNSNRQCRTEPAREQCRTNRNGERRCRTILARQICEHKPERVCRDVSYTDRVCHTIPGEETCRDVPYSNQVCEDVPRQACEWIPSREDCRTVQVGENQVCRDVTRYRQEAYACQEEVQIPYTVTLKKFNINSEITFSKPEGYNPQFTLLNKLTDNGQSKFLLKDAGEYKPMAFVEIDEKRSEENDIVTIEGKYDFKILDGGKLKAGLSKIAGVELTKEELSFELKHHPEVKGNEIYLELGKEGSQLIARTLNRDEVSQTRDGKKIFMKIGLAKLGIKVSNLQKYNYKLVVRPKFKSTLAFPAIKNFSGKKEGTLFAYDASDLQRLREYLDQLSHLSMDGDKIMFKFPNHDLITDARIGLRLGTLINRKVTKDEFSWDISSEDVTVSIPLSSLDLKVSALEKYPVKVSVQYVFSEDAPLPSDFSHSAELEKEVKPELGKQDKRKLQSDAQFLDSIELKKYSLAFKLKKNAYLNDFHIQLKVSKREKVKIDRSFSKDDVKTEVDGDFIHVSINFKKFGGKVTRLGKHLLSLKVEYKLHEGLKPVRGLDLKKSVQQTLKAK